MRPSAAAAVIAIIGTMTFASYAPAEDKFQRLTGGGIRARIFGMELTDEVHWREFYERSGRVMSSSMGRKRTGRWHVDKDQLCVEFENDPPAKCYEVWVSGKKAK